MSYIKFNNIKRLLLISFGLFKGLFKLANDSARDIQNKKKYPQAIIDCGSSFTPDTTIGNHSHILSGAIINHSHIGNYSYCGQNCIIQNTTIGNYCSIANDVMIGLGKHPLDFFSTSPLFYRKNNPLRLEVISENKNFEEYKPIEIGSDVWIGAKVIIMDGISIGHGAVVAAGAVVTKDVPPYAIIGGVPAKIIKYRFSDEKIENFLQSKWWTCKLDVIINEKIN